MSRPLLAGVVVVALAAVLLAAWVLVIGRPTAEATSSVDPDVTVRCEGLASDDACGSYGDAMLASGPPSYTFEMEDLALLEIRRPVFGGTCEARYYLQRYVDAPAWTEEVPCP
jgi:hypothetical protein